MSIYPVPLQKWFPNDGSIEHTSAKWAVRYARCHRCGKFCSFNRAWGHHSVPWGHGDIWCSEKCLFSHTTIKKKRYRKPKLRGKRMKWLLGKSK